MMICFDDDDDDNKLMNITVRYKGRVTEFPPLGPVYWLSQSVLNASLPAPHWEPANPVPLQSQLSGPLHTPTPEHTEELVEGVSKQSTGTVG